MAIEHLVISRDEEAPVVASEDGLTVPGTRLQVRALTRQSIMLRRPIVCMLLLCYLAACTSWHVEEGVSPLQLISNQHPQVRCRQNDRAIPRPLRSRRGNRGDRLFEWEFGDGCLFRQLGGA